MDPQDRSESRRDFLGYATWGMGLTAVGAGLWTVLGATVTPGDQAPDILSVDLTRLPVGEPRLLALGGKPVTILRRTPEQVAQVAGVDLASLRDPLARNANLKPDATAEDVNRSYGEVIVTHPVCTRMGCVAQGALGDFGGWQCACCASHYDLAGRIRKGPAPRNFEIPKYIVSGDILTVYQTGDGPLSDEQRDGLLQGNG